MPKTVKINTSNPGKLAEYQRLFAAHDYIVESTTVDLQEIDALEWQVVVHKASHVPEGVLVEDTSLHVEGEEVGINVKWLLEHLGECEGCSATWRCLLARRLGEKVEIFSSEIHGAIVTATGGEGFGFDPYFVPAGHSATLAQSKPDEVNARAVVVDNFIQGVVHEIHDPIYEWEGPYQ